MMVKDFNNLPEWLPKQFARIGLTVEQVANRAGISRTAIYYWLYNQCRPDEQAMIAVCRVLGVPPEEGFRQYIPKRRGRPPLRDDTKERKKKKKKKR